MGTNFGEFEKINKVCAKKTNNILMNDCDDNHNAIIEVKFAYLNTL